MTPSGTDDSDCNQKMEQGTLDWIRDIIPTKAVDRVTERYSKTEYKTEGSTKLDENIAQTIGSNRMTELYKQNIKQRIAQKIDENIARTTGYPDVLDSG